MSDAVKGNSDIKIYVSERIDQKAELIDNPLFVPIRCGAVFDKRSDVNMLGDNTGDNISERRLSFCELTVLYWAWKNSKADYIGLAHYRRFLSFTDERIATIPGHGLKLGYLDNMAKVNHNKAGLLDVEKMRNEIIQYDFICSESYNIYKDAGVPHSIKNIQEFWLKLCPEYISKDNFDVLLRCIKKLFPEMYSNAVEYMKGTEFMGFNCCVGKRAVIDDLCSFLFGVLFEAEKQVYTDQYFSEQNNRLLGYMGEWLFSIWIYNARKLKKYNIRETQLIAFLNTASHEELQPLNDSVTIVFNAPIIKLANIGVAIQSIIDNRIGEYRIDFILLMESKDSGSEEMSVEKELLGRLQKQVTSLHNVSLRVFNPKDSIGKLEYREITKVSRKSEYYLSMLPWILNHFSRVIYLRPDLIVKQDILKLWEYNLKGRGIAATSDLYYIGQRIGNRNIFNREKFKFLNNPYHFSDTGVLVMDLKYLHDRYKKNNIIQYLVEEKLSSDEYFNHFYEKDILKIDFAWNYYGFQDNFFNIMLRDNVPAELKNEFRMVKQPNIISLKFSGNVIPLLESQIWEMFFRIAEETPFYHYLMIKETSKLYPIPARKSFARKVADKYLPKGSKRREVIKRIIPRNSTQWNFLKKIYHMILLD